MNPQNPRMAIRSSSLLHIDEEIETAYEEARKESSPAEDDELRILTKIASLDNHPGWQIIRDKFLDRIEEYRSGRIIAEYLANYDLTDAQIGQATRNMNLVAGELTTLLNSVILAVQEVEKQKAEARRETRRPLGPRAKRED
jgi:hypothetical protein